MNIMYLIEYMHMTFYVYKMHMGLWVYIRPLADITKSGKHNTRLSEIDVVYSINIMMTLMLYFSILANT